MARMTRLTWLDRLARVTILPILPRMTWLPIVGRPTGPTWPDRLTGLTRVISTTWLIGQARAEGLYRLTVMAMRQTD